MMNEMMQWCRVRSRVQLDIAGTLKQMSDQHCRYRSLRHKKGDLTNRESSEVIAVDSVGR